VPENLVSQGMGFFFVCGSMPARPPTIESQVNISRKELRQ